MPYPPDDHMLRAVAIETRIDEHGATAIAPIHPHVQTDQGGMRLGVIAVVVDVVAASLAMVDLHPDRSATVSLSIQSRRAAREGALVATANLLRQGSKQVVIGVDVCEGLDEQTAAGREPVASGLIGFRRIPFRSDHAELPEPPVRPIRGSLAHPAAALDRPFLERAGARVLDADAGIVEIENHEWVRNSFGTLNGGMVASLVELAGEQAARAVLGPELVAADLELHYVGQSGEGPIRSHAERLRVGRDHCVSRVALRDAGAGDTLMAIGTVHACRLA